MSPRAGAVCSEPGCPNFVERAGRCPTCATAHRRPRDRAYDATRPSPSARGYGRAWRQRRAKFLADHPRCLDCGAPATVADHAPTSRRDLVAKGDPDPDAAHHLQPRCASCHGRRTVRDDGALPPGAAPRMDRW